MYVLATNHKTNTVYTRTSDIQSLNPTVAAGPPQSPPIPSGSGYAWSRHCPRSLSIATHQTGRPAFLLVLAIEDVLLTRLILEAKGNCMIHWIVQVCDCSLHFDQHAACFTRNFCLGIIRTTGIGKGSFRPVIYMLPVLLILSLDSRSS